ncbi:amino acid ABC transporter permease [Faecalibaculum rodentium]|mgnify:FL=1|jgi:polar amino acid transport system permease protein|uniref:Amino acid ABC transporter membrane protein, PAAT family n=3 Tax=Faecalibaculum rodentium TaxID=1702221 RepID=A0A140DWH3_9FIRM|nr:amino acid ABC transporter permease [Faecalibaculum rodentium]AMK55000.1 amino acid ABC transporter membrane protein, PAAT family [Faecalibaculum rodentium]OLU45853.1 polar amino acid ABC transporter permease [Faecalibaculum rodentium]
MDLQTFTELGSGLLVSLEIFFLTLLFSLPLGMVVAFGRMSKNRILSAVTKFYISVMRGTPLMLQLIVVYFGPYYLFRIRVGADYRFIAVILAFVLNYAAYFAEIYRSGLQAMPKGQYEAAKVLGYSKTQTFFHIILPQLIKQVLPAVTNEIITLVKDTSLAFAIAVAEMFTIAKQLAAAQATIVPLMIAGLYYYVFNLIVSFVMERIEKHYAYYRN